MNVTMLGDGSYVVWDEIGALHITRWDLEFYENIKTLYPMMGGASEIGSYMRLANCIGAIKIYVAGLVTE